MKGVAEVTCLEEGKRRKAYIFAKYIEAIVDEGLTIGFIVYLISGKALVVVVPDSIDTLLGWIEGGAA